MRATPNILVIMADQLTGTLFNAGPAPFLHVPNLRLLAQRSARFRNAYTPSPLCVPARAAFMSGQLPSHNGVYDNAAEFPASIPTFAHYLRSSGYYTVLAGKMHFVGPDQLHGFEKRLTTDIYPADFGWTPDYRRPGERVDWWYHNMASVVESGVAEISNQLEFDDEVAFHAEAELLRLARRRDARPWSLTVSFTHPHDPYVARRRVYDLYADCTALEPETAAIDFEDQDPHSRRLLLANDFRRFPVTPQDVGRARRAYFANISYLDEKIGRILDVLARCDMQEQTLVIFCSDHGDMLGERGLWYKMSFFEGSSRVPLMISGPDIPAADIDTPVSILDIAPTLADVVGIDTNAISSWTDGSSLLPLLSGGERRSPVLMEYAAEGSAAPLVAIRDRRYKYVHCEIDPPQLYDLDQDPAERVNLADDNDHAELVEEFAKRIRQHWDLARFDAAVRDSQRRRHLVYDALRQGAWHPWDFQPLEPAASRFMRNHLDLNEVEARNRYPRSSDIS